MQYKDFVIAGDVNIHVESDESSSEKFKDVMEMFNLTWNNMLQNQRI